VNCFKFLPLLSNLARGIVLSLNLSLDGLLLLLSCFLVGERESEWSFPLLFLLFLAGDTHDSNSSHRDDDTDLSLAQYFFLEDGNGLWETL